MTDEEPEWMKRAREQDEKDREADKQACKDAYEAVIGDDFKPKPKD